MWPAVFDVAKSDAPDAVTDDTATAESNGDAEPVVVNATEVTALPISFSSYATT
jgi:hypothetical protein